MKIEKCSSKSVRHGLFDLSVFSLHLLSLIFVFLMTVPSLVFADWRQFIPRPYTNTIDLEIDGLYEAEHNVIGGAGIRWTDTFIKEKLILSSEGFIYHPKFMKYQLTLSGALKQEDFSISSSSESQGFTDTTGIEYDAKVLILPEHPYNLKLFATRVEPLFREQAATQVDNVDTSWGALFRYKKRPYFGNARFTDETFSTSSATTDITSYGADVTYFKSYSPEKEVTATATYDHSDFTSTGDLTGSTDTYSLFNTVSLKRYSLDSSLSRDSSNQQSPTLPNFSSSHLILQERAEARLPLHFKAETIYRRQDNRFDSSGTALPANNLSSTENRIDFNLSHRLYESLDTVYNFSYDSLGGTAGNTDTTMHALSVNYAKAIPWGRLLAGGSVSTLTTSTSGLTNVVSESHPAVNVPGDFVLNSQIAEAATIQVFLKSPLPPFDLVPLDENVHYIVIPFGNTFRIQITVLPPQFAVPGTFDFVVQYNTSGDFSLRTNGYGYNMTIDLFHNMISPYYSYLNTQSEVLSGFFPGVPVSSSLNSFGIIIQKGPLRVSGEYQDYSSNVSPYLRWKGESLLTIAFGQTWNARVQASYENISYPQGSSTEAGPGYSVRTAMFSGNIIKQFKDQGLAISAGGSYAYQWGLTKGPFYAFNGNLAWNVGKLSLNLGADVFGTDSETAYLGSSIKTNRLHQYYYLKIKRKIL